MSYNLNGSPRFLHDKAVVQRPWQEQRQDLNADLSVLSPLSANTDTLPGSVCCCPFLLRRIHFSKGLIRVTPSVLFLGRGERRNWGKEGEEEIVHGMKENFKNYHF